MCLIQLISKISQQIFHNQKFSYELFILPRNRVVQHEKKSAAKKSDLISITPRVRHVSDQFQINSAIVKFASDISDAT